MPQSGFFWHVHHGRILLEWCYGYDERAEYIRTKKSEHERELRLRLFQLVKGHLPQEVVETRKALNEAWNTLNEARKTCNEARKAFDKAKKVWFGIWKKKSYGEAGEAHDEAGEAYLEAGEAYLEARKAFEEALSNHKDEIEALHEDECFNCPWDGETIFSAA